MITFSGDLNFQSLVRIKTWLCVPIYVVYSINISSIILHFLGVMKGKRDVKTLKLVDGWFRCISLVYSVCCKFISRNFVRSTKGCTVQFTLHHPPSFLDLRGAERGEWKFSRAYVTCHVSHQSLKQNSDYRQTEKLSKTWNHDGFIPSRSRCLFEGMDGFTGGGGGGVQEMPHTPQKPQISPTKKIVHPSKKDFTPHPQF